MVSQLNEGLVLVILTRDVRAVATELLQLLLELLCWCLDVGLDALEVLLVVHLCSRISDDANVLGEDVVAVLHLVNENAQATANHLQGQKALGTVLD
jgi:hypothetical protein